MTTSGDYLAPALMGVWGSAPDNVFAVGERGAIRHYDGSSWTPQVSGTAYPLYSVWGTAADNVFAVGSVNVIGKYDGAAWKFQVLGGASLEGLWGSSASDVYAVGPYGTIMHYDGQNWSKQQSPCPSTYLRGVWGSSGADVFAVGSYVQKGGGSGASIVHKDGTGWTPQLYSEAIDEYAPHTFSAVWGSSATNVIAVGAYGISHFHP